MFDKVVLLERIDLLYKYFISHPDEWGPFEQLGPCLLPLTMYNTFIVLLSASKHRLQDLMMVNSNATKPIRCLVTFCGTANINGLILSPYRFVDGFRLSRRPKFIGIISDGII